jgi:RNA polymerase sigma factor (sigma-70 family)
MSDTASDETLMLLYREGEGEAFDVLYARHKGPLYRYLLRQLSETAPAEALFEDIWTSLIAARADYRPRSDFRRFFYRLAEDRLTDHRHRAGHIMGLDDDCFDALPDVGGEATTADGDPLDTLLLEVRSLPDTQRAVFLLKEEAGLDLDGVAVVLQLERDTAQQRLRAAVRRLRSRWASGRPDKGKVVSLLDEVDPLISATYRDAARETPAQAMDEKILVAAHAAVASLEPVTDVAAHRSRGMAARVGWIVAGLVTGLVVAVYALKWLR